MASFHRTRFPPPSFGGGYSRSEYQNGPGMRDGPPLMRGYNENGPGPYQRFPGPGGPFHNRPQFSNNSERGPGQAPFRARMPMGPTNNRLPGSGTSMYRQPFGGPDYFRNAGPPRMRFPGPSERFFVPWNQRPGPFFGPRVPPRNNTRQVVMEQKPVMKPNDNRPKKKKNKKKKYNPRPREDAKKLKPWMTDEIYDEVKRKNELYVRAKNEDKPELWQEFKLLRNRVSSMIKDAKLKGGFITRKLKEDEDIDKPLSCDTCDRAFATDSDLDEHRKEHVKCDRDGCSFEAHPKVMELHKRMLHETGYADAILKLNNSDEVIKWRNDRKRHYPTAENIRRRKEELEARVARGEVVETQQFGKFQKPKSGSRFDPTFSVSRQRGRGRHGRSSRMRASGAVISRPPVAYSHQVLSKPTIEVDSDSDDDSHIRLPRFPGINAIEKTTPSRSSVSLLIDSASLHAKELPVKDSSTSQTPNNEKCNPFPRHSSRQSPVSPSLKTDGTTEDGSRNHLPMDVDNQETSAESALKCPVPNGTLESAVIMEDVGKPINVESDDDDDGPSVEAIVKSSVSNETEESDSVAADGVKEVIGEQSTPALKPTVGRRRRSSNLLPRPRPLNGTMDNERLPRRERGAVSALQEVKPLVNSAGEPLFPLPPWPTGLSKHNLLDKLLANEKRHERNVILQCVRYIVKNGFFQKQTALKMQ